MIESLQTHWPTLAFLAAIVGMFVLLRNRPTRIGALDDIVGSRQPVIVEVFSNI